MAGQWGQCGREEGGFLAVKPVEQRGWGVAQFPLGLKVGLCGTAGAAAPLQVLVQ